MWSELRPYLVDYYNQFDASHDMAHIDRVYENARRILENYKEANHRIVTLAVGLHDVEDKKYKNDRSADFMQSIFTTFSVTEEEQKSIRTLIDQVSFSGGLTATSLEAKIVQDADRLDAIGAIGIARTFAFGGAKDRSLYNHKEVEEVVAGAKIDNGSSVTHFYEKLLKLKDKMNTEKAKEIAEERHRFMEAFLEQLYNELGESPCRN